MAIYLDFVGLNTLVYENVTSSLNLIGGFDSYPDPPRAVENPVTTEGATGLQKASSLSHSTTGGFSVSFWIKGWQTFGAVYDEQGANISNSLTALGVGGGFVNVSFKVTSQGGSTGNLRDFTFITSDVDFSDWTHVVVVWNGKLQTSSSPEARIYINGVLKDIQNGTLTGTTAANDTRFPIGGTGLRLMDLYSSSGFGELGGSLTDLAIWKVELSEAKVQELYNNGSPFDISTLSYSSTEVEDYWRLGAEPELKNLDIGASIPGGLTIDSILGQTNSLQFQGSFCKISKGKEPYLVCSSLQNLNKSPY
tara:strand:- start:1 stop:924 length:924 start_codon:yes stop_codon:yes gene_type:complete